MKTSNHNFQPGTRREEFYLVISAGTGPYEVRRFAVLLAERLRQTCVEAGLEPLAVDMAARARASASTSEARLVSLGFVGPRGAVSGLLGTHALIFDSRRDRAGRHRGHRKRWFVHVFTSTVDLARYVTPALDPRDVDLQFSRSGGPGGQHVNTASTAVRAVHRPTGIAVRVSDSRSQANNRELALDRLAAKLQERDREAERVAERERHARQIVVVRGDAVAVWRIEPRGSELVQV
jgi:peptide chain release factor